MNNEPNPGQWGQPQQPSQQNEQPQWNQSQPPPTQYEQPQQWAQPQPQWNQQPPNLDQYQPQPQQYAQNQYNQNQYSNVPAYAQPQVQPDQTSNFLMRFFMMGIAVRIVLLILVPLLLCGGCTMVIFFASLAHP